MFLRPFLLEKLTWKSADDQGSKEVPSVRGVNCLTLRPFVLEKLTWKSADDQGSTEVPSMRGVICITESLEVASLAPDRVI